MNAPFASFRLLKRFLAGFAFFLLISAQAYSQPYWITSIGGSGWTGTIPNNGTDNFTIWLCYGTAGVTLNSNATPTSIVSGTKTYYRKWQTSSNGVTWFTTSYSSINNAVNGNSQYHRVVYSYSSSSTDIINPSPWVHILLGPSFVSTPPSAGAISTTNITGTSFTANFTTSSTAHGPSTLNIRHYMQVAEDASFTIPFTGSGFSSTGYKLITACSDPTSAIAGCTNPSTAVSYTVTGLTPGITYYWRILAQSYHENTSNGDLWCGIQSSYTVTQVVSGCTAPLVTSNPTTQSVCSGNSAALSVTATGATAYQWQLNGVDIAGATSSTYNASTAGSYSCVVYSACDSVTTTAAVVTIDQPTVASAGPDQNLCTNSATLAANTPASGIGTWTIVSGTGTFSNTNAPNSTVTGLGAGTNTFRWTLSNGACSDSQDDVIINVQTPSTDPAGITGTAAICEGSSTTLSISGGSLGSGANWEWYAGSCGSGTHVGSGASITVSPVTSTNYYAISQGGCNTTTCVSLPVNVTNTGADAGSGQTLCVGDSVILTASGTGSFLWNYNSLTTPSILVKPITTTTYTVTVTNGSCSSQDTVTVHVTNNANATITSTGTFCTAQAPFILGSVNSGGSWSGTGITNTSTGLFNPAVAGPGSFQIIHTIAGTCGDADTATISVATSANATINPAGPYCSNNSPVLLTASNAGGTWSGMGITNAATGQFSPAAAGAGNYNIIYTIAGTCGSSDTISITVNNAANATISPAGPFCDNIAPVTLNAASGGGNWSGQGITNASAGIFSPALAGPGTFSVIYTISGSCVSSDTISIIVNDGANATITPAGPYCSTHAPVTLTAADAGGTWSGLGITNTSSGIFSPGVVGAGSYSVIYAIGGACASSDTITIVVNSPVDPAINPAGPYCSNLTSATLTAGTAGGTWSGQGITNAATGQFSPLLAGSGTFSVFYTLPGPCASSDTIQILVNSAENATITSTGPFCNTLSSVSLTAIDTGGIWTGLGITDAHAGTFSPSSVGVGMYAVIYTIGGTCGSSDTVSLSVISSANASILTSGPYCSDISSVTLQAATSGGMWSGQGITNNLTGTFSPSGVGAGSYNVVYTISGSCGGSDTATIIVSDAVTVSINPAGPYCYSDAAVTLSATGGGGTWSGSGITNNTTGTFDPGVAGIGTHLITYGVPGSCGDTASIMITVDTLFNTVILSPATYCDNVLPFNLSATTAGGNWSGSGIVNASAGTFNPALAGTGSHQIIYSIAGNCGSADTINIHVYEAPHMQMASTGEICNGSNDGSATAQVTGGTAPYSYHWNNGNSTGSISNLEPGTWSVSVTDVNGCVLKDSVVLEAAVNDCGDVPGMIYIPNIFSPNGDGDPRNNTFGVIGEGIKNVVLIVYDRWGEKIFESHELTVGWDGTYKGKDMDQGVYVYTAVIELMNGQIENRKGNVTLVR
jgi:gliding motility-associated-like protein